jgi:hypothetical protein
VRDLVVGDGRDARTEFGLAASQAQQGVDMKYVEIGKQEGARLVTGGQRLSLGKGGHYVAPTLFRRRGQPHAPVPRGSLRSRGRRHSRARLRARAGIGQRVTRAWTFVAERARTENQTQIEREARLRASRRA